MLDIIIIGSGMAGMTAAIYALRNNKKVLLFERESIGGQITQSPKVENYPSIAQISGSDLADRTFEQLSALGGEIEVENVESVKKQGDIFIVKTDYNTYETKSVIISTGLKHRKLNLENEERFIGHGLYYCAICDGPFFAGQEVDVIGDANSALQYALMLAGYCKKVNIFTLFDKFFGEKALVDEVKNTKNIEIFHNCKSVALNGQEKLESITFEREDGSRFTHNTNATFVAIGQIPNNNFEAPIDLDENGYIIADENCKTSCGGIFVAGDCRKKSVRQVATAIGDGAIAATSACKYLDLNTGKLWKS